MPTVIASSPAHRWKFFRTGGLDQVALETGADLLSLRSLDQKLWVALSCPVKGLEIDEKTLALIDFDGDGRLRVPELLAAIDWASLHLKTADDLLKINVALPLSAINDATPEGKAVLASAKQILANLGKPDESAIAVADVIDPNRIFVGTKFNGDGIITDTSADDPETKQALADIAATVGAETDRNGLPGINQAKVDAFFAEAAAYEAWDAQGEQAGGLLGRETAAAAYDAVQAVRAKVDDYFTRGRLAAYDSRALQALNHQESEYLELVAKDLKFTAKEVSGFPLARVAPGRPLPFNEELNPAWADALATLHSAAITPILGADKTTLTASEWAQLTDRLAAYDVWWSSKPSGQIEKLGLDRIKFLLTGETKAKLEALIAKDKSLEQEALSIGSVERLVRYYRDLRRLVNNFVNFSDFYNPSALATFQAGTLYLDSRSCNLCVRVDDPAAHSVLATLSNVYIAYCELRRAGSPNIKIAACFTQGDSDYLMVGRNGVFYDRKGQDWDATIVKIIDNPISIRQAFWSPYKKFVRMIEDQIAKRAAAADATSTATLTAAATTVANADKTKPDEPKKIDIGTVAALGVAFGAIGTFLATLATYASHTFEGGPLMVMAALVGVVAVISGPSMIIAWIKLRQRTLGPILDANGWAVNGRVKINLPFGTALTGHRQLPPGSKLSIEDPFEDHEAARRKRLIIFTVVLLLAAWLTYNLWFAPTHDRAKILWPFDKIEAHENKPEASEKKS